MWVKIGREWTGWTRITAHSGDRTVRGIYDVLRLSNEMSATAMELAKEATTRHKGMQS